MPKRKARYPEKPWIMDPAIKARFLELIELGKKSDKKKSTLPEPKWQLWRWDTLEDVPQD